MRNKNAVVVSDMLIWIYRVLVVSIGMLALLSYARSMVKTPINTDYATARALIDRLFYSKYGISYYDPLTSSPVSYIVDYTKLENLDEICKVIYRQNIAVGIHIKGTIDKFYFCNEEKFKTWLPIVEKSASLVYAGDRRVVYLKNLKDDLGIARMDTILIFQK